MQRYVVFHTPGAKWQTGKDFREQPGINSHVAHWKKLFNEGKVVMGGPFPQATQGGMMICATNVTHHEIKTFALADPAVEAGLLNCEIRLWFTTFSVENT